MSEIDAGSAPRSRQTLLIAAIFGAILIALVAGYMLFLREDYTILTEGVRPAEAAAIVAELDKRGVAYRLADGGTTIRVPAGEADATRLALVGSDAAAAGQIGFELFNKSDMGLTNFAQKINYQRALQGELVRTLTDLDGVESARVHLALPERALFRDERTEPTAAVTVTMTPGQTADGPRVTGIQRLVAAAVPDLTADRVVVLDADGRVISPADGAGADDGSDGPPSSVEQYYRDRARTAVESRMPGLRFTMQVAALPLNAVGEGAGEVPVSIPSQGAARDFRLDVTMVTDTALDVEEQLTAQRAIVGAVALDPAKGDALRFEVGAPPPPAARPASAERAPMPALPRKDERGSLGGGLAWAVWPVVLALLLGALIVWRWRAARLAGLSPDEQAAFAQTLRRRLALTDRTPDAAG